MKSTVTSLGRETESAILCGAGISVDCGIPIVRSVIETILLAVGGFTQKEREGIHDRWQFEAFMEKVLNAFPLQKKKILGLFDDRSRKLEPGAIHHL